MQNPLKYKSFYKRRLPHIQPLDAVFFITYRLNFEYSNDVINHFNMKHDEFVKLVSQTLKEKRKQKSDELYKILFDIEDSFLSKIKSHKWLMNDKIAEIIKESLFFRNETEYELICFCIMPNHVHILIKPLVEKENIPYSLSSIIHDHKRFTAKECNKLLNRLGAFWYPDFYDHYIRDEDEFHNVINYILQNPVKAGLVEDWKDWKYSWVDENVISL